MNKSVCVRIKKKKKEHHRRACYYYQTRERARSPTYTRLDTLDIYFLNGL